MKLINIKKTMLILSVLSITGCGMWFTTNKPTVTLTNPLDGATTVYINTKISATFSQEMDPTTINVKTFTLKQGETAVSGTVTGVGVNAIFTPDTYLAANTVFTATITNGAKNLEGNKILDDYVWSFTTGLTADLTPPTVVLVSPANGVSGVDINKKVTVTFNEAMDPSSITAATFTLKRGITTVLGSVAYSGVIAIFTPGSSLLPSTIYTATVTTGANDMASNALAANYVWTFTTGTGTDIIPPTVTLVNPALSATGVCLNKTISATFSEEMDPLTLSNMNFFVVGQAGTGTVHYNPITNIATFKPASDLTANTTYNVKISTGVSDLADNSMAADYAWSFRTGTTTCVAPVALLTAAPFGTFGSSAGMTNTGIQTVINGDIGTTAIATGSITGFHDILGDIYTEVIATNIGDVQGKINTCAISTTGPTSVVPDPASCLVAMNALADAQTAFNTLAGLPSGATPAANLAGLTLAPGVYTAPAGSFMIQGNDLTLDAGGDANAVWVFQMPSSTLLVGGPGSTAPQSIILAGGALAKNIFWQVGTTATINAAGGGTMEGTIIAGAGIIFSTVGNTTKTTLNGRALALTASITMVDTVINVPTP